MKENSLPKAQDARLKFMAISYFIHLDNRGVIQTTLFMCMGSILYPLYCRLPNENDKQLLQEWHFAF